MFLWNYLGQSTVKRVPDDVMAKSVVIHNISSVITVIDPVGVRVKNGVRLASGLELGFGFEFSGF